MTEIKEETKGLRETYIEWIVERGLYDRKTCEGATTIALASVVDSMLNK